MLVDELKNKSLTKKIDSLKGQTKARGVYTSNMVQRVSTDVYEVVR